jgi:hypothetical protein
LNDIGDSTSGDAPKVSESLAWDRVGSSRGAIATFLSLSHVRGCAAKKALKVFPELVAGGRFVADFERGEDAGTGESDMRPKGSDATEKGFGADGNDAHCDKEVAEEPIFSRDLDPPSPTTSGARNM